MVSVPSGQPNWVRPVYLHVVSLFGVALMAFGALGIVMGLVHLAAPDLQQQGDPIARIAQTVVGVVGVAVPFEDIEGGEMAARALESTREELRKQARNAAANDLMRAAVLFLIGGFIYRYHEQRGHPVQPPQQTWGPPQSQAPPPPG